MQPPSPSTHTHREVYPWLYCKKSVYFRVTYLAVSSPTIIFNGRLLVEHFNKSQYGRDVLTENLKIRTLTRLKDIMTQNTCFCYRLCLMIPENIYGRPLK